MTKWGNWDAGAIDERRRSLLEWAKDRWHVNLEGFGEHDHEEETESDNVEEYVDVISGIGESDDQ